MSGLLVHRVPDFNIKTRRGRDENGSKGRAGRKRSPKEEEEDGSVLWRGAHRAWRNGRDGDRTAFSAPEKSIHSQQASGCAGPCLSLVPGDLALSFDLGRHETCMWHTSMTIE